MDHSCNTVSKLYKRTTPGCFRQAPVSQPYAIKDTLHGCHPLGCQPSIAAAHQAHLCDPHESCRQLQQPCMQLQAGAMQPSGQRRWQLWTRCWQRRSRTCTAWFPSCCSVAAWQQASQLHPRCVLQALQKPPFWGTWRVGAGWQVNCMVRCLPGQGPECSPLQVAGHDVMT